MNMHNAFAFASRFFRTAMDHLWSSLIHDHFPPHQSAGFEGYYTRVQLEDGASLVLIFCSVKKATKMKNLVHVSYFPVTQRNFDNNWPVAFKHELYPDAYRVSSPSASDNPRTLTSFALEAEGIGSLKVGPEYTEHIISLPDLQLSVNLKLARRTAWSAGHDLSSPMGLLIHFSAFLPLNWHVHSTGTETRYSISYKGVTRNGYGLAHVEKNWGSSFPRGWLWAQSFGRDGERFCMAGGAAFPGIHPYLIGYRSSRCQWDFMPPFTLSIGRFSPFMSVEHNSRAGVVDLVVKTLFRMLVVRIEAPVDTFTGLACPLKDGHKPDFAFESFCGRTWIEAWQRRWPWEEWRCLEKTELGVTLDGTPCSVLEFGGDFCHLVGHTGL